MQRTAPGPQGCSSSPEASDIKQHWFTREDMNGQPVNFQVIDLGKQLYIWVSTSAEMNNLALAMPGARSDPASSQLLHGKGGDVAQGVARRLTLKCRQPVAVSWNVEGGELRSIWAEKQLAEELQKLRLIQKTQDLTLG